MNTPEATYTPKSSVVVNQANLDLLDAERASGWHNIHPEDYCHRCGGRNILWSAPSEVWNPVMRPGGDKSGWLWNEIICPSCFGLLFVERFPETSFVLTIHADSRGAKKFRATHPSPLCDLPPATCNAAIEGVEP